MTNESTTTMPTRGATEITPDPDFTTLKTMEEVLEVYNEMVATANDFGMVTKTTSSFPDVQTGTVACQRLHVMIKQARKRHENAAKKKQVKTETAAAEPATAVSDNSKQEKKVKKASVKKASAKKAAPKKAAKKAKVAATVKIVKKAAAKKAAAANGANGAAHKRRMITDFDPKSKITWLAEGNPYRGARAKRVQKIIDAKGKTLGHFLEKGGRFATIMYVMDRGHVKLG